MARYEFKLPDIGEGIAEAEIVAWHVKVGDSVAEDQQLADMMTDKATVEMESPVAGKVLEVAGEVGDMIPIGSVLVVIETEGDAPRRRDEEPIADGMAEVPEALEEVVPTTDVERRGAADDGERRRSGRRRTTGRRWRDRRQGEWRSATREPAKRPIAGEGAGPRLARRPRRAPAISASTSARSNMRGDRIRHADLDAYLLYSGGGVARGARRRGGRTRASRWSACSRKIAENMQEAKRRIPHFTLVEEYDVTALEQTRAMMNARPRRQSQAHHAPLPDRGDGEDARRLSADQRHL